MLRRNLLPPLCRVHQVRQPSRLALKLALLQNVRCHALAPCISPPVRCVCPRRHTPCLPARRGNPAAFAPCAPAKAVPLALHHNLRNTRQVALPRVIPQKPPLGRRGDRPPVAQAQVAGEGGHGGSGRAIHSGARAARPVEGGIGGGRRVCLCLGLALGAPWGTGGRRGCRGRHRGAAAGAAGGGRVGGVAVTVV